MDMDNTKPVIIAVDDQPVILHTVVAAIKDYYQVKPFTSGIKALKFLEDNSADLIILDYQMPEINGYEVLDRLLSEKKTAGIPVVFLTGSEEDGVEVEVLERGAADFIQKPIKAQVLLARLRLQLELTRYRNHLETLVAEQTEHLKLANEKLITREKITLNLLAEVTDMRDHDTGGHISRVTEMVRVIVSELLDNPQTNYTLGGNNAENIVNSAKLHDLGKIGIPDTILLKTDRLNEQETELMRQHPLYGAVLLEKHIGQMGSDSFLNTAVEIALCHHEKWNGTGYPRKLSGEDIPLSARITAIADVYDALTSARPYKKPFTHQQALQIIEQDSGSHFDPYLVSIFLKHEKEFDKLKSELEQEELAHSF